MLKVKRSRYFHLVLSEKRLPDVARLVNSGSGDNAESQWIAECQWIALSALTGKPRLVSDTLLSILRRLPSDQWTEVSCLQEEGVSAEDLEHLEAIGLVISDRPGKAGKLYAEIEQDLHQSAWHPIAAIYHFCTKWKDVHLDIILPEDVSELAASESDKAELFEVFTAKFGFPPPHFVSKPSTSCIPLSRDKLKGALSDLLSRRRTRRVFDSGKSLSKQTISMLIERTFAPQGIFHVGKEVYGVGKTSPSGGGLHPTEVYAVVNNVDGMRPGIYHYNQGNHRLDALSMLQEYESREFCNVFTAGQQYPRRCAVLFLLCSRFYRNYWKYREHPRAYSVLFMDIAHLSQTFYLVCEELGLGAFFTAAVNAENIERELGLNGYQEGALAALGCGYPSPDQVGLEVNFGSLPETSA